MQEAARDVLRCGDIDARIWAQWLTPDWQMIAGGPRDGDLGIPV